MLFFTVFFFYEIFWWLFDVLNVLFFFNQNFCVFAKRISVLWAGRMTSSMVTLIGWFFFSREKNEWFDVFYFDLKGIKLFISFNGMNDFYSALKRMKLFIPFNGIKLFFPFLKWNHLFPLMEWMTFIPSSREWHSFIPFFGISSDVIRGRNDWILASKTNQRICMWRDVIRPASKRNFEFPGTEFSVSQGAFSFLRKKFLTNVSLKCHILGFSLILSIFPLFSWIYAESCRNYSKWN